MEVFTQWSILHLVIVTVEMHLRGFSLVLCCHILPTQNQSLFLALLLILLGDELSTSELVSRTFQPREELAVCSVDVAQQICSEAQTPSRYKPGNARCPFPVHV